MVTLALVFLITVGLLYALSIRIVSVQGYNEMMKGHGFGEKHLQAHIGCGYYVPSIVAACIVLGWYWFVKDPYGPIERLIPSYAESGWLWSIGGAYLVCIPFGLNMGAIGLLARVRPEGKWMTWLEFVILYLSLIVQGIIFFHVYNPWIIWLPMMFTMPLTFVIEKRLPRGFSRPQSSTATTPVSANRRYSTSLPSYPSSSYQPSKSVSRSSSSSSSSSSRSDSECERLAREAQANEYYDQYQRYRDEADRLMSEAESYDRSAEDNEYWARETNDSFKESEARRDRERASRLRYQSRETQRKADRYYSLYQQHRR